MLKHLVLLLSLYMLAGCGFGRTDAVRRSTAPIVSCPTSPAAKVFTSAMCLCGDLSMVGSGLTVKGQDATVDVSGAFEVVGAHALEGDLFAGEVTGTGDLQVGGSLWARGDVVGVGALSVGRDLRAGGRVAGVGSVIVGGERRENQGSTARGCGCEEPLDVAAEVETAHQHNDNAAAQLAQHLDGVGGLELTLGSGTYFFDSISPVGDSNITIDGAVAIALEENLESVGALQFELTPGSTLDLFVAGDANLIGETTFSAATPGSVRLYVGGSVNLVGSGRLLASIYAPHSDLSLVGETVIEGSLVAHTLDGVGSLTLESAPSRVLGPESPQCTLAQVSPH